MSKPKLPCVYAWSGVAVLPSGISVCCCATTRDMRAHPEQGPIEALNGNQFRKLRKKLFDGDWPKECGTCQKLESEGLKSLRLSGLEDRNFENFFSNENYSEEALPLQSLELSFDNRCNLKCRMCSPEFSSKWTEDLPFLKAAMPDLYIDYYYNKFDPVSVDIDSLVPHLGSLKELVMKGGEPMLNVKFEPFLRKLIDLGVAQHTYIRMATNGTVYNTKLIEAIKQFKGASLVVSVDAGGSMYNYIRKGKFSSKDIIENIRKYKEAGLPFFAVQTAYQIYNMLEFDKMVEEFMPYIKNFLVTPVRSFPMDPQKAPDELREEAKERMLRLLQTDLTSFTRGAVAEILQTLESGKYDPQYWEQFKKFTYGMDKIRKESIAEVSPELFKYFQHTGRASQIVHQSLQV